MTEDSLAEVWDNSVVAVGCTVVAAAAESCIAAVADSSAVAEVAYIVHIVEHEAW